MSTGRRRRPIRVASVPDVALGGFDPERAPWPGEFRRAGGASVFVRTTPSTAADPEPALYVHGLAGASTNWTDLAALLASELAGEAIDLPGFGRSGPAPGGDYTIPTAARRLIDYLERSDRGPVHLFGNSMGGLISLHVAARRPDLIRTLTLISPAVPDLRPARAAAEPLLGLLLLPGPASTFVERQLAAVAPERRVSELLKVCFADPARVPPARIQQAVDDLTARRGQAWREAAFTRSLRAIARQWVAPPPFGPWRLLGRVTAPTLVVWGERDVLVDVSRAPRVARGVPDARLLVLPDVGHTAQMEAPELTARAFLALRNDARAAGRTD